MKILAHINWFFATLNIFFSLILMIILYPILPRPYARKIAAWYVRITLFFSTDVKGEEDPATQMFLINHQSDLDIGVMETVSKKILRGLRKRSFLMFPFLVLL